MMKKGSNAIDSSRSPFQSLKASPWRRSRRGNEKSLADSVRVLVKPTISHRQEKFERKQETSTQPFRALNSLSNVMNPSYQEIQPLRENQASTKPKLHESEITLFKQLCLDKHDENAAIEILLDSSENATLELNAKNHQSAYDESRALSRKKAGSAQTKRMFLERLFFRSHRKTVSSQPYDSMGKFQGASKENIHTWSRPSKESQDQNDPTPPSSIPNTRITIETKSTQPDSSNVSWAIPQENPAINIIVDKTKEILDEVQEEGETFSNISSLSGTRASSIITPVRLDRGESLGYESIKDIRKCLAEMERQLGRATDKGQRVSREKLMRALFTVADSLEDDDQLNSSGIESGKGMKMKRMQMIRSRNATAQRDDSSEEDDRSDVTSSNDEDSTLDSVTSDEDSSKDMQANDESSFNIVSSVGHFFGVNDEDQQAVEEVLDDLFWTEFVNSRQKTKTNKKPKYTQSRQTKRLTSMKQNKTPLQVKKFSTRGPHDHPGPSLRRNSSKNQDENDSDSSSDDGIKNYLPSSIVAKRAQTTPFKSDILQARSVFNPHLRVSLVDTESRLGFEMDSTPYQLPV